MTYQLMLYPGFKDKAFTMSYDDGVKQDVRLIEIMSKHGLKGTFNLNSGLLGVSSNRLDKGAVNSLYIDSGNEVAVHGVEHLSLAAVPECMAVNDIINDRKALEDITGRVITGMAYANGSYNDTVVDILKKCGVSYARTTVSTRGFDINDDFLRLPATCHHNDERLFELAEKFLEPAPNGYYWAKKPKLFYLWGHSYEFDNNDNWDRIEKLAQTIGGNEGVWYATNGEIVDYIKAFQNLIYSADGTYCQNPTAIDVCIRRGQNKILVPSGKTVKIV